MSGFPSLLRLSDTLLYSRVQQSVTQPRFAHPLSIGRHLAYCHLLAVASNAALNMGVQIPVMSLLSFPLGIYPEVELLGPLVTLCLSFWGTARLFSTAAAPFYVLAGSAQGFEFSMSSPAPVIFPSCPPPHSSGMEGVLNLCVVLVRGHADLCIIPY